MRWIVFSALAKDSCSCSQLRVSSTMCYTVIPKPKQVLGAAGIFRNEASLNFPVLYCTFRSMSCSARALEAITAVLVKDQEGPSQTGQLEASPTLVLLSELLHNMGCIGFPWQGLGVKGEEKLQGWLLWKAAQSFSYAWWSQCQLAPRWSHCWPTAHRFLSHRLVQLQVKILGLESTFNKMRTNNRGPCSAGGVRAHSE